MAEPTPDTLLERVAWPELNELVRRQQRNREVHSPGISLFRWWARRPHGLIGALLDAAAEQKSTPVISDPLSGGGTVAMEAAQRKLPLYAQDLHPWAATGLSVALDGVEPDELRREAERWLAKLAPVRKELYGTCCPEHGEAEILNTFWVRLASCPSCAREIALFPYSLVSLGSRRKNETHAWFGCRACGHVTRSRRDASGRRCGRCRRSVERPDEPLLAGGVATCPHAGCAASFPAYRESPKWRPVLVQRLCNVSGTQSAHLARPTSDEVLQATQTDAEIPEVLREPIPSGVETARLRRAGILRWCDLYPPRQMRALLAAVDGIEARRTGPRLVARLRLIVAGAGEMAGFASRWDRYYPKAFEVTANHRFSVTGFACETNPLADRGRGTVPRRVEHSVRAAEWAREFSRARGKAGSSSRKRNVSGRPPDVQIVRGSSVRQLAADGSVDLVLTDPPYFDDVQYGELAALLLAWARATGLIARNVTVDLRSEAVPNAQRRVGARQYESLLGRIFREARRTLRDDGRMVLTFHNRDPQAWVSLGRALAKADFSIAALAVAHAENEADHSKRGRRAFSSDLVIECKAGQHDAAPRVFSSSETAEVAELLAAGRAIAELGPRHTASIYTVDEFVERYRTLLGGHQSKLISVPKATSETSPCR